jgi:hypothetical protein
MCEVRSRKNGQEQKKKKSKKKNSGQQQKEMDCEKKWTAMNPIRRRMKKRKASSGQNGQLVHWWLLVHSGPVNGFTYLYSIMNLNTIS